MIDRGAVGLILQFGCFVQYGALHACSFVRSSHVRPVVTRATAHRTRRGRQPSNDSLRALGQRPYCRVEATVEAETHIVALLPDDWNGRFLMGGAGGYAGSVENQYESTVHEGCATVGTDAGHTSTRKARPIEVGR